MPKSVGSYGTATAIDSQDRPDFRVDENGTVLLFALEGFPVTHADGDAFKHDHYRMIVTFEPIDRIP